MGLCKKKRKKKGNNPPFYGKRLFSKILAENTLKGAHVGDEIKGNLPIDFQSSRVNDVLRA